MSAVQAREAGTPGGVQTGAGGRAGAADRRRGGTGRTVVSVIGPDRVQAETVAEELRRRVPHRQFVVGAGPDIADGVVAVTGGDGGTGAERDAAVVRAVRDATGGCVLYTGSSRPCCDGPGVTVVRWGRSRPGQVDGPGGPARPGRDGVSDPVALDELAETVSSLWVDVPRWLRDARRADVDREERVKVAVRLSAERIISDLLDPSSGGPDPADPVGADALGELFLARLRCTVLEQGVEWPRVRGGDSVYPGAGGDGVGEGPGDVGDGGSRDPYGGEEPGGDHNRMLLVLVASAGAGVACALAAGRLAGPAAGVVAGVVVALVLAVLRWRTVTAERRARRRVRTRTRLRSRWGVVVAEVVSRLRTPRAAEALVLELSGGGLR